MVPDYSSGTHVFGDGIQCVFNHERNGADDGLCVKESAVLVHYFGFGDTWESGESDIKPREELLRE